MSSPSKHVKGLATELLYLLEKILVKVFVEPQNVPSIEGDQYLSSPGIIISRLLRHLWYQVMCLPCKILEFISCFQCDKQSSLVN